MPKDSRRTPPPPTHSLEAPERVDSRTPFVRVGSAVAARAEDLKADRIGLTAPVTYKVIHESESSSGYTEILAFTDSRRIGYAFLEPVDAGELHLEMVYAQWRYAGQQVGRGLIAEAERYGLAHGFAVITGEVTHNDYTRSRVDIERRTAWFKFLGFETENDGQRVVIRKRLR